ncbi:hypothetical protein ISCGN_001076 [Ixodes scapularis]
MVSGQWRGPSKTAAIKATQPERGRWGPGGRDGAKWKVEPLSSSNGGVHLALWRTEPSGPRPGRPRCSRRRACGSACVLENGGGDSKSDSDSPFCADESKREGPRQCRCRIPALPPLEPPSSKSPSFLALFASAAALFCTEYKCFLPGWSFPMSPESQLH